MTSWFYQMKRTGHDRVSVSFFCLFCKQILSFLELPLSHEGVEVQNVDVVVNQHDCPKRKQVMVQ